MSNQATITGTIYDLGGNLVTSGKIVATLQPGVDSTIPGTGRFVPISVFGKIVNGQVLADNGTSPFVLTKNSALSPTGTSYLFQVQPYNIANGAQFSLFVTMDAVDISTAAPSPDYQTVDYGGARGPAGPPATFTGLPYSSLTTYANGDTATTSVGGFTSTYVSVQSGNLNHPLSDTAWWRVVLGAPVGGTSPLRSAAMSLAPMVEVPRQAMASSWIPLSRKQDHCKR